MKTTSVATFALAAALAVGGVPRSIRAQAPPSPPAWLAKGVERSAKAASEQLPANAATLLSRAVDAWEAYGRRLLAAGPTAAPETGEVWQFAVFKAGRGGTHPFPMLDRDRCIGVPGGLDVLVGYAARLEASTLRPGSIQYDGVVRRETDMALCEVQETTDGERWCAGSLVGGGLADVTILLPTSNRGSHFDGELLFNPWTSPGKSAGLAQRLPVSDPVGTAPIDGETTTVHVGGNCSSLDKTATAAEYRAEFRLAFESLEPTGLKAGLFAQTRTVGGDPNGQIEGQYSLLVEPVPNDKVPTARRIVRLARDASLREQLRTLAPRK
jgi:hypothetical protein